MAVLKIANNGYRNIESIQNVTSYVINPYKTCDLYGGQGVLINKPHLYMETVQNYYHSGGKMMQHFILAFGDFDCISFDEAYDLAYAVCELFPDYQLVFGVHLDKDNKHIHWAMNPVNLRTGRKFNFTYGESFALRKKIAKLLEPYEIGCSLRTKDNA